MSDNRYSDSDSSSGDDELKEFVLVEFIHRGRKKKCESADIVPSKWLKFDNTRKRCLTKFLESPYGPEDIEMLHTLVKEKADAPENWPVYPVEVRGRASEYHNDPFYSFLFTDFETLVLTKLNQITLKLDDIITSLKDVQKKQNDTDTFLMDKSVVHHQGKTKIDFLKKYKLKLPIEDMETFKIFDASLTVGDQFLKADVYIELTSLVDELGFITKSFSAMMKRFIAKDVAVQFTAARKARDPTKEQGAGKFKDTALFQCMSVVMVSASKKRNVLVSDKDLIRGLSSIVCGAKK